MNKLSHNRVLNMVAALLVAFSLMCGSALQVSAGALNYDKLDADVLCRDNAIKPVFTGGVNDGSRIYATYETELQYTVETLEGGYTYNSDETIILYYLSYYYNSSQYMGSVFTEVKDVRISLPDGSEYYLDFYLNTSISDVISPASDLTHSGMIAVDVNINNLYLDVNSDIIITVTLGHYISQGGGLGIDFSSSGSANCSLPFWRILGDYTYLPGNEIIDQNNISNNLLNTLNNRVQAFADSLQVWIEGLVSNINTRFSELFQRMDEEQDELINGYQDTTTSEAANAFSSESDKLTSLEGDLSGQSNQYVSDFTTQGFDLGILSTIGSSLLFVTTWFTNFWNMGGIFTAGLNFCFALSIVFFILRFKR